MARNRNQVSDGPRGRGSLKVHTDGGVIANLRDLLRDLPALELHVSHRLAKTQKLPDLLDALEATPEDASLSADH